MFEELRRILDTSGLDLSDEELLDALWLSTRLPRGVAMPLARQLLEAEGGDETVAAPAPLLPETAPVSPSAPAQAGRVPHPTTDPPRRHGFTPITGSPPLTAPSGRTLLLPGAKVLGNELVVGRAVRPLKRRVPSAFLTELDEDATVASQADTGFPNVVLRALPERWLRLALVIDSDVSMMLWERHCRELQAVLERSGAFQQIKVHQLCYSAVQGDSRPKQSRAFLVRPWSGSRTSVLPTSTLIDPSGRTLVMVITDGAAPAWRDGRMRAELERCALAGPTAILHVLPRRLWAGTGVTGDTWNVTTPRPGAPNSTWQITDPVLPSDLSSFAKVPVPVVELAPSGLWAWATAITTVGRPAPLRLWEPQHSPATRPAAFPDGGARAFTRSASPAAVQLAAHVAAMTPVTVPVMRLVQSRLPKGTDTAALAEIFLSGLLRPVPRPGQERPQGPMKHRLFDFTAEAKDLLLDTVPLADLVASSRRVGEQIEQLVGRSTDFPAWLVPPGDRHRGGPEPFARIGRALRTRLGLDDEETLIEDDGHKTPPTPTVLVMTTLPVEYKAVHAHLTDVRRREHPRGTRAAIGQLPGTPWAVALVEMGPGSLSAAALTERVMTWLEPQAVLFVGVAGGLKNDIELGDVVVATKMYGIHGVKEIPESFLVRPEAWRASHRLAAAAREALRDDPHAHLKPIAAGDVVLTAPQSALAEHLRRNYNDAAAIEMEGSGVVSAVHLAGGDALVIRGISDRADADKSLTDEEGWQPRAAENAAAAAVAVLRELRPSTPFRGRPEGPDSHTEDFEEAFIGGRRSEATTSASRGAPSTDLSLPNGETESGHPQRDSVHEPRLVATDSLPMVPPGFTGRGDQLAELLGAFDPDGSQAPGAVLVAAVSGLGGIGKTALAVEAAHAARENGWFPGGVLFLDLHGYDDGRLTAEQALETLLRGLGTPPEHIPNGVDARAAMYRSVLAARERELGAVLVLADNASSVEQVRPLHPGGVRHRLLATSRSKLPQLGARLLPLGELSAREAYALLDRALWIAAPGDARLANESEAAAELASLCGYLPLALQIAAALLVIDRDKPVAELVLELAESGDRLLHLDDGERSMRAAFDLSYRRLPAEQARLLRLLALAPGAEVTDEVVAVLAGADTAPVRVLDALSRAHLVERGSGRGRWRLHDLVRVFGVGVVEGDAGLRVEGEAARVRVLTFYLRWARAADDRLRWLPGMPEPERFADRAGALAWLDSERAGLVAAVQWAREKRYADTAVRLSQCLVEYLIWRRSFDDLITVCGAAKEAAHRGGNQVAEAIAWHSLGIALQETRRAREAIDVHTRARDLYQTAGDRVGQAKAWDSLGNALRQTGRAEEAIDAHTRARDLYQTAGDRHSEAIAWNNLGATLNETGRVEEAIEAYEKALERYREFDDWYETGRTLSNLGLAHQDAARPVEARACFLKSADAFTRANAPTEAAQSLSRTAQPD